MTGKRILAMVMAGILLLTLVACGNQKQPAMPSETDPAQEQAGPQPGGDTYPGGTEADPSADPTGTPSVGPGAEQPGGEELLPADPITQPGQGEEKGNEQGGEDEPAQSGGKTVEDILAEKHGEGYQLETDGATYTRRKDVSAYLIIGVDKAGPVSSGDLIGGQCDVLMVLAVDNAAKQFTLLQLHRDSMVDVDITDYYGGLTGVSKKQQICFSHTYGSGDTKSCENTVRAVSRLLGGLKIDGYVSLNYGGVSPVNDAIGGVSVKIEDDMTNMDPAFVKGETVLLSGEQALQFVRARMSVGDGTNTSRMRRQRTYLSALSAKLREEMKGNSAVINDMYNAASPYLVSDMSMSTISGVAVKCLSYADAGIVSPKGETKYVKYANGNTYAEHYVDEADLQKLVTALFYSK